MDVGVYSLVEKQGSDMIRVVLLYSKIHRRSQKVLSLFYIERNLTRGVSCLQIIGRAGRTACGLGLEEGFLEHHHRAHPPGKPLRLLQSGSCGIWQVRQHLLVPEHTMEAAIPRPQATVLTVAAEALCTCVSHTY